MLLNHETRTSHTVYNNDLRILYKDPDNIFRTETHSNFGNMIDNFVSRTLYFRFLRENYSSM